MQALTLLKYAVATAAVALGFSSASADKIAFVGDGQSYSGGGDVVSIPVGAKSGTIYGTDKPVTFQIPTDSSETQIVYSTGLNWSLQNPKLILTPADGVVVNSVTFSCHTNYGVITLDGTDLTQTPNSSNQIITFSDLDSTDAIVFTHNRQNRFHYIEIEYNASESDVKAADIIATFQPNPIPANYSEIKITVNGVWAEFGTEQTFESLKVETAGGLPYTTVKLEYDFWNDCYNCKFAKQLEAGNYQIIVPAGAFRKADEGVVSLECNAAIWKFTVGESTGPDVPEEGFTPTDIYPEANSTVDASESDWMIAIFFDKAVTVNEEIKPYLLIEDEKYEADTVRSMAEYGAPKQLSVYFNGMNQRPDGEYTFVLPAGTVSYEDGQTNKLYTTKYNWEGGKKDDVGSDDEMRLVSAAIGDTNVMEPGEVVPNIPAEGCYMRLSVVPNTIEMIGAGIYDVTGKTPDHYGDSSNEAIWFNFLDTKVGNVFSKEIYSIIGIQLYEGHDYVIKADLYNGTWETGGRVVGTVYSATFTGTTPAFKYSPVELVSVEPAPGSEFKIGDKMVVTYSAPVNLVNGEGKSGFGKGNAGWANFATMSSNADKTVWTITFPNSEINAAAGPDQINPRLWGTDANGLQLRPAEYDIPEGTPEEGLLIFNGGIEATSYTQINYAGYAKCPKVVVSPLETEELTYIDFSIEGTKEINPSYMAEFPVIRNEAGEVVATVIVDGYYDEESDTGHIIITNREDAEDGRILGIQAPLNTPITTPGVYTLEIPWNLFVVGREMSSYASAPGTFTIVVDNQTPPADDKLVISCENATDMTVDYFPADEDLPEYYYITLATRKDIANVSIAIPDGYDGMYYFISDFGGALKPARVPAAEAVDEYGFVKGDVIPVEADGEMHTYHVAFSKGDDVEVDNAKMIMIKADKVTIVDDLGAENDVPVYYTIDGVKVENPVKGLYIKVTDGKASKVIL